MLKGILPDDFYCHYALLATSIYLLLQQPVTQAGLLLADKQLEEFYALMAIYYGRSQSFCSRSKDVSNIYVDDFSSIQQMFEVIY